MDPHTIAILAGAAAGVCALLFLRGYFGETEEPVKKKRPRSSPSSSGRANFVDVYELVRAYLRTSGTGHLPKGETLEIEGMQLRYGTNEGDDLDSDWVQLAYPDGRNWEVSFRFGAISRVLRNNQEILSLALSEGDRNALRGIRELLRGH